MGNVAASGAVGLLFIDFDAQRRLRANGVARLVLDDPLLDVYPGLDARQIYPNCPR